MPRCLAGSSSLLLLVWLATACTGDGITGGQTCRTDRDCNGGICQAGLCEAAGVRTDGGTASDTGGTDSGLGGEDTRPGDGGTTDAPVEDDTPGSDTGIDPGLDPGEQDAEADVAPDGGDQNACGGAQPLEGSPGDACGVCDDGELVCDGPNALECDGASAENLCGGCGPLPALPGTGCGDCDGGVWTCNEEGGLDCLCEPIEPDGTCLAPFLIELGDVVTVDLCEQGDDEDPIAGANDCRDVNVRGEELVYEIVLEEATSLLIDLRDADSELAVDTIVYLRSECSDDTSQQVCSDDIPCEESDLEAPCSGPVQVRHSRMRTAELAAGSWFIVADHFAYEQGGTDYTCGQVRLEVTEAP